MMNFSSSIRLYICLAPADMRKSINGLSAMARNEVGEDPLSGHLFIFRNRAGNRLKVLYWDRNGYAVWYKRIERGRFSFPAAGSGKLTITEAQFQLLVGGVSLENLWKSHKN